MPWHEGSLTGRVKDATGGDLEVHAAKVLAELEHIVAYQRLVNLNVYVGLHVYLEVG